MMKLICTLLLLIFNLAIFGQGKILLQDEFKNNKNNWKLQHDRDFLVEIKNGFLHLEKFEKNRIRNGCLWYDKVIPGFNTLNNFSISIYARFISGGDIVDMIDMQWGLRDNTGPGSPVRNLYQLNLMPARGEVKLDYFNSRWNYFVRKDIKELIKDYGYKPNELNKYELVQKDGFVTFSVNNKVFLKQLCKPIPGNNIGFQGCLKSVLEIDKIIVRQLPDTKPIAADTVQFVTNATKIEINPADKELKVYPNPFNNNLSATINLDREETVKVYLSDIKGVVLQQHTIMLQKGPQTIILYADVIPGSYVVKVQIGNAKVLSTTVIKQ